MGMQNGGEKKKKKREAGIGVAGIMGNGVQTINVSGKAH